MKKYLIDPIVIRERQARLSKIEEQITISERGMEALLWFDEYAEKDEPGKVLKIDAGVVASSTPRSNTAVYYVKQAVKEFEAQILRRAVELAKAEAARYVEVKLKRPSDD